MTLCVSWIRKVNNSEELIFATDSELRGGGEAWDKGVKLFELPNKDALMAFTGATARAYPLLLNLISSINYEDFFFHKRYTLIELKEHIEDLFSILIKTITETSEDIHKVRGEARLLLGGWDWEANQFRIWLLKYEKKSERFEALELTDDEDRTNFFVFIGEAADEKLDIEAKAQDDLTKLLIEEKKLHTKLDMEPLKILRDIALDKEVIGVRGSLQIAKVYKSNKTEFMGIYWPSSKGSPHFQGRKYNELNKPQVRYFDADTFELIESDLPNELSEISTDLFGENDKLVENAYPDGILSTTLTEKEKAKLKSIFKDVAYKLFIQKQEETKIAE